jgi:hypothetical protein
MKKSILNRQNMILKELLTPKYHGYGNLPIPSPLDNDITEFIDCFIDLEKEERDFFQGQIKNQHKFGFLAYAERMASYAVRKKSSKEIVLGLMAIFLQTGLGDPREDIIIYALLYDATCKIGENPNSVFLKASEKFNFSFVSEIHSFLNRTKKDKSIKSMGFKRGSDKDGFRYIRKRRYLL